jgi:hypothetical protein
MKKIGTKLRKKIEGESKERSKHEERDLTHS